MREKKIKFKIGEFSKLNFVTVKTLRYYERIGLLAPNEVDEWTGYRYYDVGQLQKMGRIIYLKKLGFQLEQIKEMFDEKRISPNLKELREQIESCRWEMQQLRWRCKELVSLEKQVLKTKKKMEKIRIESLPAIIVASHRRIISGYDELFNLCPNLIGPEMQRLGCECPEPGYCFTIDHNKEYRENNIDIEYCERVVEMGKDSELIIFKSLPAVSAALCVDHFGSYDLLPQTYAELYGYLEKEGYRIVDFPRFSYIDGIWNKENIEEWRTEIQVPVSKV